MTGGQRNWLIAGFCIFAVFSISYFYEVDSRIKFQTLSPNPVFRFQEFQDPDQQGLTVVRGVYVRRGRESDDAFLWGGVAPLIALVVAGYLFLGGDPKREI